MSPSFLQYETGEGSEPFLFTVGNTFTFVCVLARASPLCTGKKQDAYCPRRMSVGTLGMRMVGDREEISIAEMQALQCR